MLSMSYVIEFIRVNRVYFWLVGYEMEYVIACRTHDGFSV